MGDTSIFPPTPPNQTKPDKTRPDQTRPKKQKTKNKNKKHPCYSYVMQSVTNQPDAAG